MNDKMRKAMDVVFEELRAMPREQFLEELEKSKGDIYHILMESGAMEVRLNNLIDNESGEHPVVTLETMEQVEDFLEAGRSGREAGERFKEMFGESEE
jgi:hypothetical protein